MTCAHKWSQVPTCLHTQACSLHSENPEGEFVQSDSEFVLDTLSPRTRDAILAKFGELEVAEIEPETASFLRGFLLGKFKFLK